ncbi:MAG: hypothetical protein K2H47_08630 [Muribaculaceae bacterium]|nr:hypothetical protein [Muribaculaceae bacterium]
MDIIPKKYLAPSQTAAAMQHAREWLSKGLEPYIAVRQLLEEYRTAKTEARKRHIGLLIAYFTETLNRVMAEKIIRYFGFENHAGCLRGETALLAQALDKNKEFRWREKFSRLVTDYNQCTDAADPKAFEVLFDKEGREDVFTLHPYDNIFAFGGDDGRSVSLVIVNTRKGIEKEEDEEDQRDVIYGVRDACNIGIHKPAYLGADYETFISLEYKIKQVCRILDYILFQIGFPYIKLNTYILFYKSIEFTGIDETEDTTILFEDNLQEANFFGMPPKLFTEESGDTPAVVEIKQTLLNALKATAVVYRRYLCTVPSEPLTDDMIRDYCVPLFKDTIETADGLLDTRWVDYSADYNWRDNLGFDSFDELMEMLREMIAPGDDMYPGSVIYLRSENENYSLSRSRKFNYDYTSRNYSCISGLNPEPSHYRSVSLDEKTIVLPSVILDDDMYTEEDDSNITDVREVHIDEFHPVMSFVEKLLVPYNCSLCIRAKDKIFPSLKQVIFYKPGYMCPVVGTTELEEHTLSDEEPLEIHLCDYDYMFGKPTTLEEEEAKACYFIEERYDVVYSNMAFFYYAKRDYAELIRVGEGLKGRLIVPDTIRVFGKEIPVRSMCIIGGWSEDEEEDEDDNDYSPSYTQKGRIDIEEFVLPHSCVEVSFNYNYKYPCRRTIIFRD